MSYNAQWAHCRRPHTGQAGFHLTQGQERNVMEAALHSRLSEGILSKQRRWLKYIICSFPSTLLHLHKLHRKGTEASLISLTHHLYLRGGSLHSWRDGRGRERSPTLKFPLQGHVRKKKERKKKSSQAVSTIYFRPSLGLFVCFGLSEFYDTCLCLLFCGVS